MLLLRLFRQPFLPSLFFPLVALVALDSLDSLHAHVQELRALHGRHKAKYASNPHAELDVW